MDLFEYQAKDLFAEYGDLPPESAGEKVYGSTPYPPDKMILFHNESSHLPSWPLRQFFACILPSETGGETPLLDCRKVCDALDPELRAATMRQVDDQLVLIVRTVLTKSS